MFEFVVIIYSIGVCLVGKYNTMAYSDPVYHGGKNFPHQIADEALTCPICLIPGFRKPKMLPQCGHTFCTPCIERYLGIGERDAGGYQFPCPLCKMSNRMSLKGINGLPNNMSVDIQIDRLLLRHNKERGRDNSLYNISCYTQHPVNQHASFPVPGQKIYKNMPYGL